MAPGVFDGQLLGHSHPVLDLGEGLLDRVQVGRVWRQEPEPRAGRADHAPYGDRLVRSEVVHDDDISGPEHRHEQLLDIGAETLAIDRAVEDAWCRQPVAAQGTEEGQRAPVTVGCKAAQTLASRSPTAQWRHVGLDPGLVDEDQPVGIEIELILEPLLAPDQNVGTVLFSGVRGLFLRVMA